MWHAPTRRPLNKWPSPLRLAPQVPFSKADQHLNDTPRDILLNFQYAIRDLSEPKGEFVPLEVRGAAAWGVLLVDAAVVCTAAAVATLTCCSHAS